MKIRFTFLFLILSIYCYGQDFVFDTTKNNEPIDYSKYYSKTDFTLLDTLSLWNYLLDTTYHGRTTDSVKPIGLLVFWRTKSIDDGISKKIYGRLWTPYMEFEIFKQHDLSYCYQKSLQTRVLSSCVPPDVGGDIISINNFIFLSSWVCLNCQRHDTKVDYCRPVINFLFSKIDISKTSSLQSLVQQFVIERGELPLKENGKK